MSRLCQDKSDIVLCKRNARNGALRQITTSSPLDGAQPFLASLREAGHTLCDLMSSLGLGLPYQELRVERFVFSMGSSSCLLAHESSFSPFPLPHYLPKQKIQSKEISLLGHSRGICETHIFEIDFEHFLTCGKYL